MTVEDPGSERAEMKAASPASAVGGSPEAATSATPSGAASLPAHQRPFEMHVGRYLATGPAAAALVVGGALLLGATGLVPVVIRAAALGGVASAAGLVLGAGLVRPWKGGTIEKVGPRLLGAQALGLVGVIAVGLLVYSAALPEPRSYGIVVAGGFLLGAVFQALSFKADLDASAEGPGADGVGGGGS